MVEYISPFNNYTDEDFKFLYTADEKNKVIYGSIPGREIYDYKQLYLTCDPNFTPKQQERHSQQNKEEIQKLIQKALDEYKGTDIGEILSQIETIAQHSPEDLKDKIAEIIKSQSEKDGISPEDKEKLNASAENINASEGEMTADERLPEAKEDDGWQKDICEAVEKANTKLKQKFEKYKDPDHPEHLFFKDDKNNTIAFASKEQAYVEGEQAAFDELVVSAQNLGKTKINFGKFEKHPEYKARLYLACLKYGMEMKGNIPGEEELKNSPEYAEIQRQEAPKKRKELRKKLIAARDTYRTEIQKTKDDEEYKKLDSAFKQAQKDKESNDNDETREALTAAQKALEENPTYQSFTKAKSNYQISLQKAAEFYIQFGSGKGEKYQSTPEERKENIHRLLALGEKKLSSHNTERKMLQNIIGHRQRS